MHDEIVRFGGRQFGGHRIGIGDDLTVSVGQRQLQRPGLLAQFGDGQRQGRFRGVLDTLQQLFRIIQQQTLVEIEGGLSQLPGVLHGLVDPYIEPTVDAAMQKAERVIIDHPHRGQCEQDEDHHHPHGQTRTGPMSQVLFDQADCIEGDQADEDEHPHQIDQQQRHEITTQLRRVLHRTAHQVQ